MKIERIEVSYHVKRTGSYQAIDTGMTVTVAVAEGEKPVAVYEAVLRQIAPRIEQEADAALADLLRLTSTEH